MFLEQPLFCFPVFNAVKFMTFKATDIFENMYLWLQYTVYFQTCSSLKLYLNTEVIIDWYGNACVNM